MYEWRLLENMFEFDLDKDLSLIGNTKLARDLYIYLSLDIESILKKIVIFYNTIVRPNYGHLLAREYEQLRVLTN